MIRHLFLWKTARTEAATEVHDQLVGLADRAELPGEVVVQRHQGEVTPRSWHGVLSCDFESPEDLGLFMSSPDHLEVVSRIRPLLADLAMIDVHLDR